MVLFPAFYQKAGSKDRVGMAGTTESLFKRT